MSFNNTKPINIKDFPSIAREYPKYSKLLLSFYQIDIYIKNFIINILNDSVTNSSVYYIKTELISQCYVISIYNIEVKAIVAKAWTITEFLDLCSKKNLELLMNALIKQILLKFNDSKKLLKQPNINWVH